MSKPKGLNSGLMDWVLEQPKPSKYENPKDLKEMFHNWDIEEDNTFWGVNRNYPAKRLEQIQELMESGMIDIKTAKKLLSFP